MEIEKIIQNIPPSWRQHLSKEFRSNYFKDLTKLLKNEYLNHTIYPEFSEIFNCFYLTPLKKVSVVIIGQDPYHGHKQAHGLSFSVNKAVNIPPSLKNIFKELNNDLNIIQPKNGNLECWAHQGVFLLNSSLTVREGEPNSHQNFGWQKFTDTTIKVLSEKTDKIVFMLWGNFAQKKEFLIDKSKHTVLKTSHPSPFSAYKGFLGCRHFSKTNAILENYGKKAIDWRIH